MDKCNVMDIGHGSMNNIASKFDVPMWRDDKGQLVTGKPASWHVTMEGSGIDRVLSLRFWQTAGLSGGSFGTITWMGPECPCEKVIAVLEALEA